MFEFACVLDLATLHDLDIDSSATCCSIRCFRTGILYAPTRCGVPLS